MMSWTHDKNSRQVKNIVHIESKKLCHYTFVHNFYIYADFKILSLLYSLRKMQQNLCDTAHHTLDCVTALRFTNLAKLKI